MFVNILAKGLAWFAAGILLFALIAGLAAALSPFIIVGGLVAIGLGAL